MIIIVLRLFCFSKLCRTDTIANIMAITILVTINCSYLLDGNQQQQGMEGPHGGPQGMFAVAGERPGPQGSRGGGGQHVGSRQRPPLPPPGCCPARFRPHLPRCIFTSVGTSLRPSKMYHGRPCLAFLCVQRGSVCTVLSTLLTECLSPSRAVYCISTVSHQQWLVPRPGPPKGEKIFPRPPSSQLCPWNFLGKGRQGEKAGRSAGSTHEAPRSAHGRGGAGSGRSRLGTAGRTARASSQFRGGHLHDRGRFSTRH